MLVDRRFVFWGREGANLATGGHAPLILYSPVSRPLRMLRADEVLEPMVSTRSKLGVSRFSGWRIPSPLAPARRAKGLRRGMARSCALG